MNLIVVSEVPFPKRLVWVSATMNASAIPESV